MSLDSKSLVEALSRTNLSRDLHDLILSYTGTAEATLANVKKAFFGIEANYSGIFRIDCHT